MSEDLTMKLPKNDSEKITYVVLAVQDLTSRLQALDDKVEERFYDTRPIWEQVIANVAQLQEGQHRIEETLDASRKESRETRTFLRDILRRMSIFNDTLVTMQADYRDI